MTTLPRELLKDYKQLFCSLGPVETRKLIRQRVVNKYGHAWYMKNLKEIEKGIAKIETTLEGK